MDVKARNKKVKGILSKEFGKKNVSVVNGRGTAWGWCNVYIKCGERLDNDEFYTQRERDKMNSINQKANELIKNCEFYSYSADDGYGTETKEVIIQVNFTN